MTPIRRSAILRDRCNLLEPIQECPVGKGDKRTKRGKIFRGSHGKTRPKGGKKAGGK